MRKTGVRCLAAVFYAVVFLSFGIAGAQIKASPTITVYKTPT